MKQITKTEARVALLKQCGVMNETLAEAKRLNTPEAWSRSDRALRVYFKLLEHIQKHCPEWGK